MNGIMAIAMTRNTAMLPPDSREALAMMAEE